MRRRQGQDNLPTRIFLLGFMGSGKSTIGPILANVLGYDFVDLDAAIEARHGKSIADLFNELGESGFRKIETAELADAATAREIVVSAGGGAVTVSENRSIMAENGFTVYLRLAPELLSRRLSRSKNRPLLYDDDGRTLSGDDLVRRITRLVEERAPLYESADLVVDVNNGPVGQTVDIVVKAIYGSAKSSI